jgi:hypothetical protein
LDGGGGVGHGAEEVVADEDIAEYALGWSVRDKGEEKARAPRQWPPEGQRSVMMEAGTYLIVAVEDQDGGCSDGDPYCEGFT